MSTRRRIVSAVVLVAALVLAAILLSILVLGLGVGENGSMSTGSGAIFTPLRSYLFRNSLRNTLTVLAIALPLASLLGLAAVTAMAPCERSRGVMAWLLLLPLAMPLALGMPAWRLIFAASPALAGGVWPALIAVGVIHAWRILPFAAFFFLLARPLRRRHTAIGLMLCCGAYMVVADVGVALLLTGGAPFNATHVLASWAYQIGVAGAMPQQSATMAVPLLVILAVLSWGMIYFARGLHSAVQEHLARLEPASAPATQQRRQRRQQPRKGRGLVTLTGRMPQAFGSVLLASPVIIVLLLPLSAPLVMAGDLAAWPAALGELFGRRDYGFWLANTILLAGLTTGVTVLVAIPAGRRLAAWQSSWSVRLADMSGLLGMMVLPVAFVPLAWLQARQPIGDARWLLALIYGAAALCIGTWLVSLVSRGAVRVPRPALTKWLVLLCYLLVTHEMAGALALSNGFSRAQSLNGGLVTRLVFDTSIALPVIGLAILMPVLLSTIFYAWLGRTLARCPNSDFP